MPSNEYVNKVVFGSDVIIDLTSDTAVEEKVLGGYYFHKATGERVAGTCQFDVDSSSATATAAEVLATKTFAKNGAVLTGEMPNRGAQTPKISTVAQQAAIQAGYHDGSGYVEIDPTEQAKVIASNIKEGVTILGVQGTHSGAESVTAVAAVVTPSVTAQTVLPSSYDGESYDYFSQVTVSAIPYTDVDNAAGGRTVTIG